VPDLESAQGLDKAVFWFYFQECEHCGNIARADGHICPIQENPFKKAEEVDGAAIGNGYEADAELSPVRNVEPSVLGSSVYGKKRIFVDLTLDNSD
jgi:hypothetical protein